MRVLGIRIPGQYRSYALRTRSCGRWCGCNHPTVPAQTDPAPSDRPTGLAQTDPAPSLTAGHAHYPSHGGTQRWGLRGGQGVSL
eukprot:3809426-Pyramimonas_sp.AAC.1